MLNKITVYTVTITSTFVIKAKSDAEAVSQAQGWVKEDVSRLNYAPVKQDGYEPSLTP